MGGRYDAPRVKAVRDLIHFPNDSIRQEALLAFSYLSLWVSPDERYDDFLKIVNDPNESDVIRESALMGYSYMGEENAVHPEVSLTLYAIASDPSHPAWSAALSRLGEVGGGYAWGLLKSVKTKELTEQQRKILNQPQRQLYRTISRGKLTFDPFSDEETSAFRELSVRKLPQDANRIRHEMWVAMHAASVDHPLAQDLRRYMKRTIENLSDQYRKKLSEGRYPLRKFWTAIPKEKFDELFELEISKGLGE